MAVVNVKSPGLTNRDGVPAILNNPAVNRALLKNAKDYCAVGNGDSIASVYRCVSVPSHARVSAVRLSNDAITTCAGDIGVYRNTRDGAAAVSAGFFGTAVSLATAGYNTDVTNESTSYTLQKQTQPIWQALGFAADPQTTFDICVTLTAAAASAGSLGLSVDFVD